MGAADSFDTQAAIDAVSIQIQGSLILGWENFRLGEGHTAVDDEEIYMRRSVSLLLATAAFLLPGIASADHEDPFYGLYCDAGEALSCHLEAILAEDVDGVGSYAKGIFPVSASAVITSDKGTVWTVNEGSWERSGELNRGDAVTVDATNVGVGTWGFALFYEGSEHLS